MPKALRISLKLILAVIVVVAAANLIERAEHAHAGSPGQTLADAMTIQMAHSEETLRKAGNDVDQIPASEQQKLRALIRELNGSR
jgi:hypothetical protein